MAASLISITKNIQTDSSNNLQFEHSENLTNIETKTSYILVFGSIQNDWFYNKNLAQEKFALQQYEQTFYQELNGHFSLVIISKNENYIRLVSNRTGGYRLYFFWQDNKLLISNSLKLFKKYQSSFDNIALRETLQYRWNSGETSLISGIRKLPSSSFLEIKNDKIVNEQCFSYFPLLEKNNKDIDIHVTNTSTLLTESIVSSIKPKSRIAVLLSGGVDSSVLAALANNKIENLVAISHRSIEHENPELDTAIQFAKELGIEHRIIDVNNDDIKSAFISVTRIIEQPARYQSSLILYKMFQVIANDFDQIIYGEAADTLFGTGVVKRWAIRQSKQANLNHFCRYVPFSRKLVNFLPKNNKFRLLQNETLESYILDCNRLEHSLNAEVYIDKWVPKKQALRVLSYLIDSDTTNDFTNTEIKLVKLKSYLMRSDCDNHFHETGSIAAHFDIELISPFVDHRVINYAAQLNGVDYFGNEFVKPILRKIGEQYFTSELMYLPKLGFPAPYKAWTNGILNNIWKDAKQHFSLSDDYNDDVEFRWTMASLYILALHLNIDDLCPPQE